MRLEDGAFIGKLKNKDTQEIKYILECENFREYIDYKNDLAFKEDE